MHKNAYNISFYTVQYIYCSFYEIKKRHTFNLKNKLFENETINKLLLFIFFFTKLLHFLNFLILGLIIDLHLRIFSPNTDM